MRRRALVAAVVVLAALSAFSLIGPAFARSGPGTRGTATPAANPSPASAATPAGASGGGPHTLSRTDRGILLVTLTFLVGAGLLGAPDTQETTVRRRPAITLYDDPALVEQATPRRRRLGEPPPLR